MAQRNPPRRREDTGGQGSGVAPAWIGIEWVLAFLGGMGAIIAGLIVADIAGA